MEDTQDESNQLASYSHQFVIQPLNPVLGRSWRPLNALTDEQRRIEGIVLIKARQEGLNAELLAKIAYCESQYQMIWNYLHDTNPGYYTAYGVFQVVKGHEDKYGLDRTTLEGNIQIAFELFKANGTKDWDLSKECWSV